MAYSKLIISFGTGKCTREKAQEHIHDLRDRLANRVQLSTDNFTGYRGSRALPNLAKSAAFGPDPPDKDRARSSRF